MGAAFGSLLYSFMEIERMQEIIHRLHAMGMTHRKIDELLMRLVQAIELNSVGVKEFKEGEHERDDPRYPRR